MYDRGLPVSGGCLFQNPTGYDPGQKDALDTSWCKNTKVRAIEVPNQTVDNFNKDAGIRY